MKVFCVAVKPETEDSYLFLTHDYSIKVRSYEDVKKVYQWLPFRKVTLENICKFSSAKEARNSIKAFYPNIKHISLMCLILRIKM